MTTNELLIEFIEWSNRLETIDKRIPKSRANIFLKNNRPEFKNLDIPRVRDSFHKGMPMPGDYYETTVEKDWINPKNGKTWGQTYLDDLQTWMEFHSL